MENATKLPPRVQQEPDLVMIEIYEEFQKRADWRNSENGIGNTKFFLGVALFVALLYFLPLAFFVGLTLIVVLGALIFFVFMPFTHFSGRN